MAITTTLAACSTNPALNGPDGSTDLPSALDDAVRYALSFIAQLRDGTGFTASGIPLTALASMPVIRGGISGTDTNPVNIGYHTGLAKMVVASNGNNFSNTWPIDITGNAATATTATSSAQLGGVAAAEYVKRISANVIGIGWTGATISITVDGNTFSGVHPMTVTNASVSASCSGNAATATTASNSNALGGVAAATFVQKGPGSCVTVEGPRNVGTLGRAIPNPDNRVNYFNISGADLIVEIDGVTFAIQKSTPSDERLKTNIRPTVVDSAADIGALDFKAFDFTDLAALFGGQSMEVGVIAQQAEKIRPAWVKEVGEYKQLDTEAMLMSALHAIQQQGRAIAALTARVEALEASK